jgi:Ca2+:H+ antiporter
MKEEVDANATPTAATPVPFTALLPAAHNVNRTQASASAAGFNPLIDTITTAVRDTATGAAALSAPPIELPSTLTADEFTRAVAAATVSALRQQQDHEQDHFARARGVATLDNSIGPIAGHGHGHDSVHGGGGGHGHDAPSWSRLVSASVLLGCTVLYALIAGASRDEDIMIMYRSNYLSFGYFTEILVNVVDVVLDGSGIDEKFLGITLFALVPNTTEFMNAISFALNDNIALR